MLARFFVNRPIFAWVISLVIMIIGAISVYTLSVEQYPDIAPPRINISSTYNGASAEAVENSVTQVIEQQLVGLDGLLYFSSSSSSSGSSRISVSFEQGVNPDIAQVQVQNKVSQVLSRLPEEVRRQGVTVVKAQTDFLMMASIYDSLNRVEGIDVADYLVSNLQDAVSRLDGVGGVQVFGGQYAMRIWLDPLKLEAYGLMPSDIEAAVNLQNAQVSAGKIGERPFESDQELNTVVVARSKLRTAEEFKNVIIKNNKDGSVIYLKDVARVELGSQNYGTITKLNGYPSSGIAIQLASGANAVQTANNVKKLLEQYEPNLPEGFKIAYPRDTTLFIESSIKEVVKTLFEAILLVVLVMYLFLKSWRATIIPAIAVPVVLLGTFAVLSVFGYTINTLTMFAMVLSIGLLVDDAIVVVENVERNMREKKLSAKEATIVSMNEITSALIGIATVLSVVFLPMSFFGGSTGVIYKQFSITIVSSMLLSVVVALTLTPALCAAILKPHSENTKKRGFMAWFHEKFDKSTQKYKNGVSGVLNNPVRWICGYMVIIAVLSLIFIKLPTSFLPKEDQAGIMVQFTLPTGASITRTAEVGDIVKDYFLNQEANNTNAIFTMAGFRFGGSGQNGGMAFISLKGWDERKGDYNRADIIAERASKTFANSNSEYFIRDAKVIAMNPPVIQGLGQTDGFEMQIQADASLSREELMVVRDAIIKEAETNDKISSIRADNAEENPQLRVVYDAEKAFALGLALSDIDKTLSAAWSGVYINDFIDKARVKRVYMQGDAQFRSKPEDLYYWHVKNKDGKMTPFSAFAETKWEFGSDSLTRYNGLASYELQGAAALGVSSGEAMDEMDKIALKNAKGTVHSWSGLSFQERLAGGQSFQLYAISVLIVFLCLAALYESWSIPFSVLMVIPLGIIGTVSAAYLRGLDNDVYFQVALLTTIGLASKNAILIVEFVESAYKKGKPLFAAAVEGASLRLRPILMTSLAFVAGVLPLAMSTGAGANSRTSIGTGIIGGTLSATALAIFFVPLFYIIVKKLGSLSNISAKTPK
ncbi:MAG: efflux RND transporter permease subunit [Campylobacteraceae bacterium]|jgi:multidrug efflux pump|nr:efflux RND transporter permease subunit [Campylobacteraceae bacterium]